MAFPELPETSKMKIFESVVYYLRTSNVNIYVSKVYLSGLTLRGSLTRDANWLRCILG